MSKGKKINPRRRPVNEADMNRAKELAKAEAVRYAWAIVFTVLRDKEGYDQEAIRRVWKEIEDMCQSIVEGYVSLPDLERVLRQEAGVVLE